MGRLQRWLDGRRAEVRRDVNKDAPTDLERPGAPDVAGGDDDQGVVADEVPDPSPAAKAAMDHPLQGSVAGDDDHGLEVTAGVGIRQTRVPPGVDAAAGWSWRLLILGVGVIALYKVLAFFSELTVPIAIAILLCALLVPFVELGERIGLPRGLAAAFVVLFGIAVVGGMLTLVGTQVTTQFADLRTQVVEGITQMQDWAKNGPLKLSDAQVEQWIERGKAAISSNDGQVVSTATEVGGAVTRVLGGLFIVLFGTYFFLYQGSSIWTWIVRIFPRDSRPHVDSSGRVAWVSLTAFVRATVIVALTDALGISIGAALLGVPLTLAIGVLVFLGAFVPIVGAVVAGFVAVIVALVAQGFWTAVFMLVVVIAIQQLESHVLQPFLMGRLVAVHPLAIILAIGAGLTVAGVVGALVSVPLAACINAVAKHLASGRSGAAYGT